MKRGTACQYYVTCILTADEGDRIRFPLVSITFCPAKPVSSLDASPPDWTSYFVPSFNLFIILSSWLGQLLLISCNALSLYIHPLRMKIMDTLLLCFLVLVLNARNNLFIRERRGGPRIDLLPKLCEHALR